MIFNIEYTNSFSYKENENVSFRIVYNGHDEGVKDFLLRYPDKRITIKLTDELEDEGSYNNFIINEKEKYYINLIKEGIDNFVFEIPYNDLTTSLIAIYRNNNIDFYFSNHVTSWDQLSLFIGLGVSDILATEEMCFSMDALHKKCKAENVRLRVIPNICQSSVPDTDTLTQFFIRPEALEIYAQYVDIFECWGPKQTYNALYETYVLNKMWYGPLNEIILGLKSDIDNRAIVPVFDSCRLNCNKRCIKGGACQICYTIEELAETLKKKNIIVKIKE